MGRTLEEVEIFRPGRWNGQDYTLQDVDDLVDSYADLGYIAPVKLGHADKDGAPAYGWVSQIRRAGNRVIAMLTDLPDDLYDLIRAKRYNSVSVEIYKNLSRNGKVYSRALKAVALLGAQIPAVSGLKPLSESLSADDTFDEILSIDIKDDIMSDDIARLKEENTQLQAELVKLRSQDFKSELDKLNQTIESKEQAIVTAAAKIAALETELNRNRIAGKVSKVTIPAYRPIVEALYLAVDGAKVVKFADGEKTGEALVDALVDKINVESKSLFTETGRSTQQTLADEAPHAKLDRLAQEWMTKHGEKDYGQAMHAVLKADRELAMAYAQS
jgi:hypothetical protein